MEVSSLNAYGVDSKKGVARCMNDENIYKHILAMFLKDDTFDRVKDAYTRNDMPTLFRCAHELKGVSGNAALADLYEAVCPLVEALRDGGSDEQAVDSMFASIEAAYLRAREGIALLLGL